MTVKQTTPLDATKDETYTYDPLNNLKTRALGTPVTATTVNVHDAANQLLEGRSGTVAGALLAGYVYDANGSLTKKCVGGTVTRTAIDCTATGGAVTSLTYDSLDRMTQAAGATTESYAYDQEGKRIKKVSGATTTNFHYMGPDIYAEYGTTFTAQTAITTHGPGNDDPIMRQTGTGTTAIAKFYHQDGLGSVVAVSTATGTTDGTQRFDAWGNKTTVTGAAIATFGYTGREPDASGLTYYRARYYDPASRRFTQRDPIGFGGGLNQYAYVGNNPVNRVDPSGLAPAGPSNSNGTSYPGNSSSGCLSQLTPGEEQTATDAVAEVEGIDFSHGPVVVAGALQCLGNVAPGMLGAGLPGYQGLQQQNQDPGGYEAALGLTPSAPPSMAQQIGNEIGGFVNGAVDGAVNLGNLIFRNDSRELGRNLEADGFNRQTGTAAHHIVPSGSNNPNAVEARNRLQGFGIDINSAANGVFLPTTPESQAPGAYHPSLHTDRYYNSVNKALGRATNTQEALDALSGIRGKLLNNQF